MKDDPRELHARPKAMTTAGAHAARLEALPRDVATLARVVQGLLLHEHWAQAYGVTLTDERREESQLRPVERMLDRLLARDQRPLSAPRPPETRLVGVCRHFTVLLVAMLRAHGVAARARVGFGAYFNRGSFEDHWVCEHWDTDRGRWVLVDAQLDQVQAAALLPDFDVLDVPRDRFLVAGDAWHLCRTGAADPAAFGIFDMRGLWFVAGNLVRDAAALNGMEMLPWDVWGAMAGPEEAIDEERMVFFDRLASLTREPVAAEDLRALYASDDRLRVPATVFNALRNRQEQV